jgi:hypothetical protein
LIGLVSKFGNGSAAGQRANIENVARGRKLCRRKLFCSCLLLFCTGLIEFD